MDWGVAQAVECLLCKCEALSSNPSGSHQKKKKKQRTKIPPKPWSPMGVHQITKVLHIKGYSYQGEETAYRMEGNLYQLYI
jgi:hypothetical protein